MKKPPKPKPSIRIVTEKLSDALYQNASSYRFKKKKEPYDEGYLKAADWMQELCLHYIREDERLKRELVEALTSTRKKIEKLRRSPKTQGMLDAIEKALSYVKSLPSGAESGRTHRSSLTAGELQAGETGHSCR